MITGMSYGALSLNAKVALARGAAARRHLHHHRRRRHAAGRARELAHADLRGPAHRYGINVHHLRQADAIELTIGQGAKPGTGGLLLGSKVSDDDRQAARPAAGRRPAQPGAAPRLPRPRRHDHQDRGAARGDRLAGARSSSRWAPSRVFDDVKLAAKAGADVVVVDGMEGGTGASPEILQEHTGIPTLAAVCEARAALEDMGLYGEVQLIIAGRHPQRRRRRQGARARGGRRLHRHRGPDRAELQQAASTSRTTTRSAPRPCACHHCHTGRCPVGITTQDPELMARLDIDEAAERVRQLAARR